MNTPGHKPEIFTYGNRNPQGLAIPPETGAVWANEHGPQGGDELNILLAGKNYGWPIASYGREYGPNGALISRTRRRKASRSRFSRGCRRSASRE